MDSVNKIYYQVEIPLETIKVLAQLCEDAAMLASGDLTGIYAAATKAYTKRMNKPMPSFLDAELERHIKAIENIGWDETNGEERPLRRYSNETDTLWDISEVLNCQMAQRGDANIMVDDPVHWNKDVPLCRILKVVESSRNRTKQLKVIVE